MEESNSGRGKILTYYLVLMIAISILNIFNSYDDLISKIDNLKNTPYWLFNISKIIEIFCVMFYVAVWKMKKWGVFGLIALFISSLLINSFGNFQLEFCYIQIIGFTIFLLIIWKPFKRMS